MKKSTISLENMPFYAYHGYHPEEQRLGNRYQVDLSVELVAHAAAKADDLASTIDYSALYRIVDEQMKKNSKLLEHIAHSITKTIFEKFQAAERVSIKVSKFNPPIGGLCEKASVQYEESR